MAEGAISQALYSRPRWWSKPFAQNVAPVHDGGISFLPSLSPQATLVEQALRTKIHTETCWRENAFTQAFSFTNVHRANFLPKPPGHAKSARPRGRLRPSNSPQWSFELFTSGISPYHCGQLSESRRSFQQNAPTLSAKHLGLFSETLRSFQQNATTFSAKHLGLFTKTPRPFHQNAPAFSTKHFSHFYETLQSFQQNVPAFSAKRHDLFSETPRHFHQKETPDGAGFLPVPRPVPGCPDYSPVFTSC